MISRKPAGRSLRKRLALAYAAGIYAAGVVVLVMVVVPLGSIDAAVPKGRPAPSTVTGAGPGIGLAQLLIGSAVALVILVPVALALGWYVAGRFLRPLRAIIATANVISAGDLHRRLDLGEPADELTELGHTLDDLFARLQAAFDAQRHFVANASLHSATGPWKYSEVPSTAAAAWAAAVEDGCPESPFQLFCRTTVDLSYQDHRSATSAHFLERSARASTEALTASNPSRRMSSS